MRARRSADEVLIRPAKRSDFASLRELALEAFGEDFATQSSFFGRGNDVSLVAEIEDQVAGFGTAGRVKIAHYPKLADHFGQITGMLHSVVVGKSFRGRGIASQLVAARIAGLQDLGCDCVLVTAWKRPRVGIPMHKILIRHGFERVGKIPFFWEGATCGHCGDFCTCDAIVYRLELSPKSTGG